MLCDPYGRLTLTISASYFLRYSSYDEPSSRFMYSSNAHSVRLPCAASTKARAEAAHGAHGTGWWAALVVGRKGRAADGKHVQAADRDCARQGSCPQ